MPANSEYIIPPAVIPEAADRRPEDDKSERRRARERERLDEERVLEPWERYRALSDHNDSLFELTELIDRKTRFALLILGALNALNLVVLTRSDMLGLAVGVSTVLRVYLALYVGLSLYCFVYAITALRPRRELTEQRNVLPDNYVRGLRMADRVVEQTPMDYERQWRELRIGELNRELSLLAHGMAHANLLKLDALHRVFTGLTILVVISAAFIMVIGITSIAAL